MTAPSFIRNVMPMAVVTMAALPSAVDAQVTYHVDHLHSTVIFRLTHLKVSHFYGRFREISGEFSFDNEKPENSSIKVSVKVDSVRTDHGERDLEIQSNKMLDAEAFPAIDFVSRDVKKTGDNNFEVTGDMTFHGVTKALTVQVERTGEVKTPMGIRSGIHTVFTIKRSDYGLNWLQDVLGDEVQLIVSLEGVHRP